MRLSALLLPLTACGPTVVDIPLDQDGDGLMSDDEATAGSDPTNPDSDGDSWLDGDEVSNFTNPVDSEDHPYTGGWPIASCRNDFTGSGAAPGETPGNFGLRDQFGDTVRLHDFCDRAVMLVVSAEWCGPCQDEAATLEALYQTYVDRGFMIITLMTEDASRAPPAPEVLTNWATSFGLTFPVVADPEWIASTPITSGTIPSTSLIAPGMEFVIVDEFFDESAIEGVLPK